MKYILIIILVFSMMGINAQNGVAISTSNSATPDASAILDVQSTTQGVLVPRMNKSDRDAITAATGLLIYQTDNTPGFYYYDGSNWKAIGTGNSNVDEIKDLSDGKTTFSGSLFLGSYSGPGGDVSANIGVGTHALETVSGGGNVAIGYYSLNDVTNGHDNTGIGYNVGEKITTGKRNTLIGADVAKNITTGERNIVIGYSINTSAAAANNELNIGNSFYAKNIYSADAYFGINTASPNASAALDITSSSKGLLIPRLDIADLSTAAPVTSPATSLIAYNTNATTGPGFFYWNGSAWTTIGGSSSVSKIDDLSDAISNTSDNNVFLGDNSGTNATAGTGIQNVGVGIKSLKDVTSGANNTSLGYNAGSNITTGNNNIIIGSGVTVSSATANNEINMGSVVYATDLYGTAAKVGIGFQHNAPKSTLDVKGSVSKTIVFKTADYTATAYDYTIIYKHTSGSPTLTLPDATAAAGRIYVLRTTNVSSGQEVTITAAGSDKIYRHSNSGFATMELGYVSGSLKYYSETLQSDGAGGWWIIDAWEEH